MIEQALDNFIKKYSPLSDETLLSFKKIVRIRECIKGDFLVKEGDWSDSLFFVIKGSARTYYLKKGKDITDWFALENELICAITSFFMKVPSPHYIEILEDSILMELKRDDIENLYNLHPDFERFGRLAITKNMLDLQQRIISLQFETAEQKYNTLISNYPQIELRVPLKDIASFLGISAETLSRIRAKKR